MSETILSYNDSYEYSFSTESPEDYCQALSIPYMGIFLPILYATVFLVGIVGNAILMGALIFKFRVRRLIDIFILNLAASDFVFLLTLPLWVHKEIWLGVWRSGSFLCKGSSYIISVNMYCSIFLLTCMSADRYLAIIHPSVARKVRTRFYTNGLCICVWILSCLLGLPTLLSRELRQYNGQAYCTDVELTPAKRIVSLVTLILAFFFPLLSILTFYCSITKKLCMHYQKSGKHDKKLRKSIKIVFIVVAAFVFSWIPYNIFKLLAIISGLQDLKPPFCLPYVLAQVGMEVSSPFAFANSCANPFIYYCFDGYIHRNILRCLCPWVKGHSTGSSSDSLNTRISHSMSTFINGEDAIRKRRRSLSL
ncbi:G-protein coupled receptor 15 [Chelonia mydas]|uniref:G-protein coupled receptor 15 n=1 Tax=Chelonia mydas TaxID=8469 RepID=UPI0018A232B4|nr:G-protein coupled receptor 15 [Chelonia mydas]